MHAVGDIRSIWISLEVESKPALFILLAAEGTVNRLGSGALASVEGNMFTGATDGKMFTEVRSAITEEMLTATGIYEAPEKRGMLCRLTLGFKFKDGSEDGFHFSFGSESQGPPKELGAVVRRAIELTQPWYDVQKGAT